MKIILDRDQVASVLSAHVDAHTHGNDLFGEYGNWALDSLSKDQAILVYVPRQSIPVSGNNLTSSTIDSVISFANSSMTNISADINHAETYKEWGKVPLHDITPVDAPETTPLDSDEQIPDAKPLAMFHGTSKGLIR
tara:strand:+ start:9941 stop:10351 length:411 start_codon:yes stop_codon:yes gene_type:complete